MLSQNLEWFYPEKIEEALLLIQKPGVMLHAGGTKILRIKNQNIKGLVDISELGLDYIRKLGKNFHIGAAVTFGEIIHFSRSHDELNFLANGLSVAASTPVRNRISIGGSLKDFALWTNLYAPLLALNASIVIKGEHEGTHTLEEYLANDIIKSKHLIKEIIVSEDKDVIGLNKRFALLRFEYPIFNISAVFKSVKELVIEPRIFITGIQKKYKRAIKAEAILSGKPLTEENIAKAVASFKPHFADDYKYSGEYKEEMARVYLSDLLNEIKESRA